MVLINRKNALQASIFAKRFCLKFAILIIFVVFSVAMLHHTLGFYTHFYPPNEGTFYAAHGQDRWLKELLSRVNTDKDKKFKYVEIGAFDGITGSNLAHFDLHRQWQGLCYEPNPDKFALLSKSRPSCHKINAALCDPSLTSEKPLVYRRFSDPFAQESGILDFLEESKREAIKRIPSEHTLVDINIYCHQLSSDIHALLDVSGYIDVVSLDAEGSELSILQSVNWSEVTFDVLFVERSNERAVIEYMTNVAGYIHVARVGDDNVFFPSEGTYIFLWKDGCECLRAGECKYKLVYPDMGWHCEARPLKIYP